MRERRRAFARQQSVYLFAARPTRRDANAAAAAAQPGTGKALARPHARSASAARRSSAGFFLCVCGYAYLSGAPAGRLANRANRARVHTICKRAEPMIRVGRSQRANERTGRHLSGANANLQTTVYLSGAANKLAARRDRNRRPSTVGRRATRQRRLPEPADATGGRRRRWPEVRARCSIRRAPINTCARCAGRRAEFCSQPAQPKHKARPTSGDRVAASVATRGTAN